MHLDQRPCASYVRFSLLVVEVVRTWASPSIQNISTISISRSRIPATDLLIFLIFVVSALAGTSHARLLISLCTCHYCLFSLDINRNSPFCFQPLQKDVLADGEGTVLCQDLIFFDLTFDVDEN